MTLSDEKRIYTTKGVFPIARRGRNVHLDEFKKKVDKVKMFSDITIFAT